ncbi:hypothetical protein [Cytobacillus sp. IB215316]|uniref:hypothetical protein n=1 Tax=Cytobacillus sp. IB215316 TaxID=3097354 RepID=UPI002A15D63E|nr:hypothetical protein [Cytobacillus sp. IB215316]MDX8360415.1 hypothetical protein [Cytobacillus sp. IB215316]
MKKFVLLTMVVTRFLTISIVVYHRQTHQTKTLMQLYEHQLSKVSTVTIVDGSTGYKKTVIDQQVIDAFLENIQYVKFIPDENQELRDGFRYAITLYEMEDVTFNFSLTKVDGVYDHTEPDMFPIVDEFYNRVNIEED